MTTFLEIVDKLISQKIGHINTMFVAKVISVGTYTCDVKPKFYYEIEARGEKFKRELPVLRGVQVVWPRGGNSLILLPIKVGDVVLVGCSQFAIDKMLVDLGEVKVNKDIMFVLEGAVILGGFVLENEWGETIYGGVDFEIPTKLTVVSDGEILVEAPDINLQGDVNLNTYRQDAEPTINADDESAIWVDTNDSDRVWLLFRRGTGDQVKVELT